MKISENGINMIKEFEGLRLEAYKPLQSEQYYTIGYGHYGKDVKRGMRINTEVAERYLKEDLEIYEANVNKYNKYKWNQNEFDALVSFAYNIGSIDQLTNNGKRTKKEIAEKILLYVKAGGRILDGLKKRRKKEHDLFVSKAYYENNISQVVKDVIQGKYGNGEERRIKLAASGYDYNEVQRIVNEELRK